MIIMSGGNSKIEKIFETAYKGARTIGKNRDFIRSATRLNYETHVKCIENSAGEFLKNFRFGTDERISLKNIMYFGFIESMLEEGELEKAKTLATDSKNMSFEIAEKILDYEIREGILPDIVTFVKIAHPSSVTPDVISGIGNKMLENSKNYKDKKNG